MGPRRLFPDAPWCERLDHSQRAGVLGVVLNNTDLRRDAVYDSTYKYIQAYECNTSNRGRGAHGEHTGQPPGQTPGPLASPAKRLQAKRFLRMAQIGDTAIAVVILLGGFLASNIDRIASEPNWNNLP